MNYSRQYIGKLGEKTAEKFLLSRRFRILNKNFSTVFGEIDMIAQYYDYIVFFEIKTRISEKFGPPFASITKVKQKHILRNCLYYLKKSKLFNKPCRIDIIAINLNTHGKLCFLKHVKNAIPVESYN